VRLHRCQLHVRARLERAPFPCQRFLHAGHNAWWWSCSVHTGSTRRAKQGASTFTRWLAQHGRATHAQQQWALLFLCLLTIAAKEGNDHTAIPPGAGASSPTRTARRFSVAPGDPSTA
jgi:hypothetical protein